MDQFIETEKYDAKMTYKKFTGYSPGVAVIGDLIVGIENRGQRGQFVFYGLHSIYHSFSDMTRGRQVS